MPIKGLTDRGLAFPQIGVIRKGSPKQKVNKNGKDMLIQGKDLQHFRVEFDENEVAAAQTFKGIYGDEPKQIKIVFPFNEVDRTWDAYLEAYTASRLLARSDGENIIYWRKEGRVLVAGGRATVSQVVDIAIQTGKEQYQKTKIVLTEGCPVQYIDGMVFGGTSKTPAVAKPVGRLRVVLPELRRLATLTFMTTSKRDIISMGGQDSGELGSIIKVCQSVRVPFAGVPLILKRRQEDVSVPKEDGTAVRVKKWMVHIEPDPEFVARANIAMYHLAMPSVPLLNSISDDDDEEIYAPAEPTMEAGKSVYEEVNELLATDATSAYHMLTSALGMDEEQVEMILKETDAKSATEKLLAQNKELLI
jgi:hypothetical protein